MIEFGGENLEPYGDTPHHGWMPPFLLALQDCEDHELRVVIAFPRTGEKGEDLEDFPEPVKSSVEEMLMDSTSIYENMDQVYEILFQDYILYQNYDERFSFRDEYESWKGKHLVVYERSRLLDYCRTVLLDVDLPPGNVNTRKHYGIFTEFHILEVITHTDPIIRKIDVKELIEKEAGGGSGK